MEIDREIGNSRGECQNLGNIGNAHLYLGEYNQAIEYHQRCLFLAQEIGERPTEGRGFLCLGAIYLALDNYSQAVNYYQQSLQIACDLGDLIGEAYSSFGLAQSFLRYEFDSQTDRLSLVSTYCDRALSIATELDIPLQKECRELKQQLERLHE